MIKVTIDLITIGKSIAKRYFIMTNNGI